MVKTVIKECLIFFIFCKSRLGISKDSVKLPFLRFVPFSIINYIKCHSDFKVSLSIFFGHLDTVPPLSFDFLFTESPHNQRIFMYALNVMKKASKLFKMYLMNILLECVSFDYILCSNLIER